MAEEQQANKEKEANSGSNNGKEGPGENGDDVTDGEPAKKKAKKADEVEVKGKEDLFSYHDFDIDIPDLLDPVISSAAPAAAAATPTITPAKSASPSVAAVDRPVSSGPNKRSLNL